MKQMELWVVNIRDIGSEVCWGDLMPILSDRDYARILNYRQSSDKLRFLVGRILIRTLAIKTAGTVKVSLGIMADGKPYFVGKNMPFFNLSHSEDFVVLAFGKVPVGVDVERIRSIEIADYESWLTKKEREEITDGSNPFTAFFRIWTMREAFAKLDGRGIGIYDDVRVRQNYKNTGAQFRVFFEKDYILTVCASQIPHQLAPKIFTLSQWREILILNQLFKL